MLKQIENLLNLSEGSLESDTGIDTFKRAISELRETSEKYGAENAKTESYQAGERSTFKKVTKALQDNGFEAKQDDLIGYLNSDEFKAKLGGSKDITETDIKNSAIYKQSILDLQGKITDFESRATSAMTELNSYKSKSKKESLLTPLLSGFDTTNEELTKLVTSNLANQYDIDENGNALINGNIVEDEIKNPVKFAELAKKEMAKYLKPIQTDASPHDKSGSSNGKGALAKLSGHGKTLPTNSTEFSEMIRDTKLPMDFRKDLRDHRQEIEATYAE